MAQDNNMRGLAAGILGTLGFFGLLGSAGTDDCRDRIDEVNKNAGYEVISDDDLACKTTTNAVLWASVAALGGAVYLATKNQKQK